jgi:hypothetical protein
MYYVKYIITVLYSFFKVNHGGTLLKSMIFVAQHQDASEQKEENFLY